jgi:dienelactone hydrolase
MTRVVTTTVALMTAILSTTAAQDRPTDQWLSRPVDDATFRAYLEFFTYDAALPFDARVAGTSTEEGIKTERLSFQSTPGNRVTASLAFPPGAPEAAVGAVILLHGGGAQGKDAANIKRTSRVLARAGLLVLAIDMAHFGERADGLFPTFAEVEKHERLYNQPAAYLAFVTQTVKDVSRSYDFLVRERGAGKVAVLGFSRGAVLATIAGGAESRLAAVALLHGGHFDFYENGHLPAACPANYIGRISPRPLLMINATNDADFLPDHAVRPLQRLARQPAAFRWTEGGHGFTPEEEMTALVEWLRRVVR